MGDLLLGFGWRLPRVAPLHGDFPCSPRHTESSGEFHAPQTASGNEEKENACIYIYIYILDCKNKRKKRKKERKTKNEKEKRKEKKIKKKRGKVFSMAVPHGQVGCKYGQKGSIPTNNHHHPTPSFFRHQYNTTEALSQLFQF
jgi:hypothetical protein